MKMYTAYGRLFAGLAAVWLSSFVLCGTPVWADAIIPVDPAFCTQMRTHRVISENPPVGCERLKRVQFSYYGFDGRVHDDGEIVVMDALAPRVANVFATLKKLQFPIAKARPIESYDGNDEASMADDNTSAFNDRPVTGGTKVSLHAYGAAIDLNPVENPFLSFQGTAITVAPAKGANFINRMAHRPGKADRAGLAEAVADVFAQNGFTDWGGYWDSPIDYQHFDIGRALAEELAGLPPDKAAARFEASIRRTPAPAGK